MCVVGGRKDRGFWGSSYLKGSTADVAGKWLESRVFPAVSDQVRGLTECLSTDSTFVRLLSCQTATRTRIRNMIICI